MISKRKLALGAALVVVLALAGAAVAAAAGHDHGRKSTKQKAKTVTTAGPAKLGVVGAMGIAGDFAAAASYLGITTDALKADLKSGKTLAQVADSTPGKSSAGLIQALVTKAQADLAAAVTAGKLTQTQADAISSHLTDAVTAVVDGTLPKGMHPGGGPGFGPGPGFGHGPIGDAIATATTYLGISAQTLMQDLTSGKSLAQVADSTPGKSADGLVQALVAAEQAELKTAVTAGKLTQAQADALSSNLTQRITALVNGTPPAHAYGGAPGGWGKHGGGMPPVPGGSNA